MGIPLEHLHGFVAADRRHFLIRQTCFDQSAHGFMAQVVESEIGQVGGFLGVIPGLIEQIWPSYTIATRFTKEHEIRLRWPQWVIDSCLNCGGRLLRQRYSAWRRVFGDIQSYDPPR